MPYEQTWRVNAYGAFLGAKELAPDMIARGRGIMLFTGATAGIARVSQPMPSYCQLTQRRYQTQTDSSDGQPQEQSPLSFCGRGSRVGRVGSRNNKRPSIQFSNILPLVIGHGKSPLAVSRQTVHGG